MWGHTYSQHKEEAEQAV
uniref:Uncharacterized protein n=1 Tax=Arundo donax TaxID=35708 RepID=A0A0A9A767_ARUDO